MSGISKYLPGLFLCALVCSPPSRVQLAAVTHHALLRRDPLAKSPVVEHLPAGAHVTLVDGGPDSGYYHVRTEGGRVGWVFSHVRIVGRFVQDTFHGQWDEIHPIRSITVIQN